MMKIMLDRCFIPFYYESDHRTQKKRNQVSVMQYLHHSGSLKEKKNHFDIMIDFLPKEKTTSTSLNN